MSFHFLTGLTLASTVLVLAGCGRSTGPELAEVSGTVTINGVPADHGQVYFYPDKDLGTTGPMSIAEIRTDGTYSITAADGQQGAVVGHHRVRVEIRHPPKDMRDTQPALATLPKYNNQMESGLTAHVEAGENNVYDFEVEADK
ncbi:MAG: hypothetical protein R3C18_22620 [Planctomycetaceae bacterium]